ncbi:MAG: hypothetical protein ACFFAO_12475 [Candidatus Hermodarchaeota archaeon]
MNITKLKKSKKIKITSDKCNGVFVIYTKDVLCDEDIIRLKEALETADKYVVLPSEYIKKVRFVKRK